MTDGLLDDPDVGASHTNSKARQPVTSVAERRNRRTDANPYPTMADFGELQGQEQERHSWKSTQQQHLLPRGLHRRADDCRTGGRIGIPISSSHHMALSNLSGKVRAWLSLDSSTTSSRSKTPISRRGLNLEHVPEDFHEPFILSGYRCHNIGPFSSLKSAFLEPNNEAINVWTHFLPSFYFLWKLAGYVDETEDVSDGYYLPWFLYFITLIAYPVFSCFAHALSNMSVRARHLCYFVDYFGCSWYSLGAAISYHAYSVPVESLGSLWDKLFLWGAMMNSCFSTVCAAKSRFVKKPVKRKLLRFMAFFVPYVYDSLPILFRLVLTESISCPEPEVDQIGGALSLYSKHFIMTFFAAFFYIVHFPERFSPGRFDIVGHSHQLFHIASALASSHQMEASRLDMMIRRDLLKVTTHTENVNLASTVFQIGTVLNIFIVLYFIARLFIGQKRALSQDQRRCW